MHVTLRNVIINDASLSVLTDGIYDLCQENAITNVCLKVSDNTLVPNLLQIMIRPICINLEKEDTRDYV